MPRCGDADEVLLESPRVIQITPQMRVLVAVDFVDFRKGIDGLARLAREELRLVTVSCCVFLFSNRRGTSIKLLVYDGQGFWLCTKRLSNGRFQWWPAHVNGGAHVLEAHQAQLLLYNGNPALAQASPVWRSVSAPQPRVL
jgi:transposase